MSYPALDISAYGYDLREATQAFHDIFIATFEHYTAMSDEQLTDEAQELKVTLLDLIKEKIDFTEG